MSLASCKEFGQPLEKANLCRLCWSFDNGRYFDRCPKLELGRERRHGLVDFLGAIKFTLIKFLELLALFGNGPIFVGLELQGPVSREVS